MNSKRILVFLLLAVVVAALAWTFLRKPGKPQPRLTPEEIQALNELEAPAPVVNTAPAEPEAPEASPEVAKVPIVPSVPAATVPTPPPKVKKEAPALIGQSGTPSRVVLPNGREVDFVLPAEGEPPKKYLAGGHIYEIDYEGNAVDTSAPKLFESDFENKLLSLFEGRGAAAAAFAKFTEEEAVEFCKAPTYQEEGDTPEMLARRESVALMKSDILEYIENGGTFQDYVAEIRTMDRELKKTESGYRRDILAFLRAGDVATARQYLATANELLKEAGYEPLKLPPGIARQLEE